MGTQTRAARALAIGRKIAEIEAEIRPLAKMLAELKHEHALLFAAEEPEPEAEIEVEPRRKLRTAKKRRDDWMPLPARVMEFFAEHPDETDIDAIAEAVGGPPRQSLRGCLVALFKEGKLVRVSKGVYAPAVTRAHALVVHGR